MKPDFHDLVGDEGTPEELDELRQVHELLLSAAPPPSLAKLPRPRRVRSLRKSWGAGALAFAATASAVFGLASGYAFGHHGGFNTGLERSMHGVGATTAASAVIHVGGEDSNGNRAIQMSVEALPSPSSGRWYELYLTKKGKLEVPCGIFRTGSSGRAQVNMNAPADLEEYDGWVVTTVGTRGSPDVLLTT